MKKEVLIYCENVGIYEIYTTRGYTVTYYSYYGNEGIYKVTKNVKTGKETREKLRYKKPPKFLKTKEGFYRYNYFTG